MSTARPGSARLPISRARAALVLILVCAGGCSPAYVLRAGWEEARILSARRPIRAVIHDTTVARETRDKLRLVLDARDFAERDLKLRAGASYESFAQLNRDTLVLNVLAAPEFALRWKTWWFPIVGHLPYKGYFDFDDARAEAASLAEEGYDVSLRPVSAFSTLGWFPDPIMSTTLRLDSLGLVETVIHEITHSTYFPTGQADFNESFANFVGHRGAIEFFCEAVADESACQRARWRWEDTRVFGHFFHSILAPLEEVYASTLPDDAKRAAKREVFEAAARRFDTEYKPRLHARYASIDPDGLDNAWIISRLLYYTRLDDFERVYESHGALVPAVEALMREAAGGDPWEALTRLLGSR
ncbi:aminopeptidase [Candidatus Palauibacter soopunensis]|uniref:aminopeptidase n=1 Tax=Candidatus Palauibacter soopunensis TaxID=3056739 RepID=UPI0023944B4F|nr:aminopeptidase [Candidatus Palauibacter soopunensis]MDE2878504.1 aminopeptidase [Candidatus Palauibacter soopunensis]